MLVSQDRINVLFLVTIKVNEDYRYYVQEIDDKIVKNYKDSPWKNS